MSKESQVRVLDFNNHLLQTKSIAGVLSTLEVTVKQNGGRLDFKHPHVSGLVDGLGSSLLSTATSSAALLVLALQRGWLDFPSLLSTLVSQAAFIRHYPVAVHTITNALLWEVKVQQLQQSYVCPYSLRMNVHPFISMLNSRTECGWCAVSELKQVYQTSDDPCIALKMVEPFIKYVLLHPSPSSEVSHIGHSLQSELISMAAASLFHYHHSRELADPTAETKMALQQSKTIVKFLIQLIPLLPTKSDRQLMSVASLLEKIINLDLEIHRYDEHHEQNDLVDMCFSYVCELTERGLPCHALFKSLFSLFKNKEGCSPHHWLVLSWLILQNLLNPLSTAYLLDLCSHLYSESTRSLSTASSLLCYPLVQLLAQPSTALQPFGSHDVILSNQKTASTLLKLIEGSPSNRLNVTSLNIPPSCSRVYSRLVSTIQLLVEVDTQKLQEVANKLNEERNASHGSRSNIVLALSALALEIVRGQDIELLKGILSALNAVAKSDPSESPSILPFFLYLQSVTQNPQFKVSILYSIPSLATHKLATVSIVSTIQALGAAPSLLPLAIRLMGRLWLQQDHVFPFLNELLSRVLPPTLPAQLVNEVILARAIVMRDVCQLRAELHGEEMLSHISKFLLVSTSNPLPVAMVIEGLVALCQCEVMDVGTLWGVLGGQHHSKTLVHDTRTPVVIALCGLFELASEVDTETRHANKVFKVTALKYLWNCALSEDPKVCSAAFRALSKFLLENYLPDHMPPKTMAKIGLTSSTDGDTSTPLCGKDCMELVHHIPVECAEAYSHFLTSLVRAELKGVQRGVVYSALREVQVATQAERTLQSVKELLPSLCSANLTRDIQSVGLIKGTMMLEYRGEGRSGRVGKQALSKELDHRQTMLEALLREATLHTSISGSEEHSWMGLSCLCVAEQWKVFVGNLLDTFCQFGMLDTHSVSVEEDSKDPVFLKKKREALHWSVSQVLDKLHSFARSNPDSASNVLLALTGVISNTPQCGKGGGHSSLLMDMVDGYSAILLGQEQQAAPTIVHTLLGSSHPELPLAVVLSVPDLVDSIMTLHWDGLTDTVSSKLVALIGGLFEHFNRSPQWYTAVVLNQVLMKTLPTVDRLRGVMTKIVPFLEASTKSNGLELLSLTAGLLPSLLLYDNHSQLAKSVLSVLQQKLSSLPLSELSTAPAQLCSLHLAGGVVSLYATGQLTDEEAMLVVTVLAELASKAPELVLLHLSLSVTLCGLGAHGCHKALSIADTIAAKWIQEASELLASEEAGDKVVPMLCGLSGLLGVNPLHCVGSSVVLANNLSFLETLYPLVFSLLQKYVAHTDNTVCSSSVWLLSQVHLVVSDVLRYEEKVPANYSYLPDDSVLNNLYLVMESLSSPPHHPYKVEVLKHLLKSLVACEETQLPPANFSGLLAPLLIHRGEIEQRIIECLMHLRETQGLRQLASYCCTPLVFSSLKIESKCMLLENMTVLLLTFPIEYFAKFLQSAANISVHHLHSNDEDTLLQFLLTGVVDTFSNGDITDEAKGCLSAVIMRLFSELCGISERTSAAVHLKCPVLEKLATCLSHCDPKQVTLLCEVSKDSPVSLRLCVSSVMHCCWVRAGVRKVKTLTPVVEWILNNIHHSSIVSPLSWLLHTIVDCCSTHSSKNSEMNQSGFLHLISSWTKATREVTSSQGHIILLLVTLVCGGSNTAIRRHMDIAVNVPVEQQWGLQSLITSQSHLHEPPESHPIRDKLCVFLLDLMNISSLSKDKLLGLISTLKSTEEFSAPLIWTSIAQWWD